MNTEPIQYPRWEAVILFFVGCLIFARLQILMFPVCETFMVFITGMIADTLGVDEAGVAVQSVVDSARAGTEPSDLIVLPTLFVAFVSFSIWMFSAISTLWIMLAARRLVERAIDELFPDRSR